MMRDTSGAYDDLQEAHRRGAGAYIALDMLPLSTTSRTIPYQGFGGYQSCMLGFPGLFMNVVCQDYYQGC